MPKPRKERRVDALPKVAYFKPQGVPLNGMEIVALAVEEYEAIRLADLEGLNHDAAAVRMDVSRPTFTRLLAEAHRKLADAIVHGKAVRIEGGTYAIRANRFVCPTCETAWEGESEEKVHACPRCGGDAIHASEHGRGRGNGRGRRRRGKRMNVKPPPPSKGENDAKT